MNAIAHHKSVIVTIARSIIYGIVPAIFVFAIVIDINPVGKRHLEYRVGTPSSLISQFFPAQRLAKVYRGSQSVLQTPVYFTVRYPHRYDSAAVKVFLDNPRQYQWKIGVETAGSGEWQYTFVEPDAQGVATFSLAGAKVTSGRLRFMIAISSSGNVDTFDLKGVAVDLQRESLLATLQRYRGPS